MAPSEVSEKYADYSKIISERSTQAIDMPTPSISGLKFALDRT